MTTEYDREFGATEGIDQAWDAGGAPVGRGGRLRPRHDLDGDGIQSDGEPGIQNVTLTLTGPNGQPVTNVGEPVGPVRPIRTASTSSRICRFFRKVRYTVTISGVPEQFKPTAPGASG